MSQDRLNRDRNFEQEPYIYRIHNLDGGLVTSISTRLLPQEQGVAGDILNFDFRYPGIPMKRKGTAESFPEPPVDKVFGIHRFERTFTDDEYILIACEENEDGKLMFWNEDTEEWEVIKDGLPTEEPDFNTFADQCVIAYPNYPLFSWDGEEFREELGAEKAELSTYFTYENNDLEFTAKEAGEQGNYIEIEIIEPEEETQEITVETEGEQTEEDPFVITIIPEWKDTVKHKMMIYLDYPSQFPEPEEEEEEQKESTWKVGDPFSMTTVDYDITAEELKEVLQDLYGDDEIESVEYHESEEIDFVITFATLVNSHMRADFSGLYWEHEDPSPEIDEYQEYEDAEILSTAAEIKEALEANEDVDAVLDVEYLGDGSGKVFKFEKSALTGGFDPVQGAFLEDFRTRLLMAGDPEEPNKLRACHTGDPSLWDPNASGSNAFDMFVGPDDGTTVTGILEMGDGGILIGKHDSTYGLFGYTRENMVVDLVDSRIGVVNHDSMGFVKPYALFVSWDGIYRYESGQLPEKISLSIQSIFDNEVDHDRLDEASAVTDSRAYILSLPDKEEGSIVLVYYADQEKWSRWDQPDGRYFTNIRGGYLFVERDAKAIKEYGLEERTDDGFMFETDMTTIELDTELPERIKYFDDLYIILRTAEIPYQVDVEVSLDGLEMKEYARTETIEGEPGKQKVLRVNIGKEARFMEIRMRNEDSSDGFQPLSIIYTCRPLGVL